MREERSAVLFRDRWPWPGGTAALGAALRSALRGIGPDEVTVVCLGSPRQPGDALGPLVGSILARRRPSWRVHGTLEHPLDAGRLEPEINRLMGEHPARLILAVDAATGPIRALGQVTVRRGPIWPALGLGRLMLPLGDLSVTGVVKPRQSSPLGRLLPLLTGRPERRAEALASVIAEGILKGLGGDE